MHKEKYRQTILVKKPARPSFLFATLRRQKLLGSRQWREIFAENRDDQLPQEKLDYRWQQRNVVTS